MQRYWAEIHNHNEIGYGQGSLDRSYCIAKSLVDVYAFTCHGWWHDPPESDPIVKAQHEQGFTVVSNAWPRVVEAANSAYAPGSFVTFVAYEWHSMKWGDYCVYYPGSEGELFRACTIQELQEHVRINEAIMIPHHGAYRRGFRGTDWSAIDSCVSPVAEVFSEHGNSLEPVSSSGMHRHSMGGTQYSQTVGEQVRSGRRIGFIAGTDNHYGAPASYGEGLTALYAEELTREAILKAFKARHTYAVTGDRIGVSISTETGGVMGDTHPPGTPQGIKIDVEGQDQIDYVELFRNGTSLEKWNPACGQPAGPVAPRTSRSPYLLRIEFGWGGMGQSERTDWSISLNFVGGSVRDAIPYFSYGSQTVDVIGRVNIVGENRIELQASTSRDNLHPTQILLIVLDAAPTMQLEYSMVVNWRRQSFRYRSNVNWRQLAQDDVYVDVAHAFSAPVLKFHRLVSQETTHAHINWEPNGDLRSFAGRAGRSGVEPDGVSEEVETATSYYIKVVQKNGQMAWTSPVWFL